MKLLRLVPAKTTFQFIRYRTLAYVFSFLLMVGSVGLALTQGLNFGIDFKGGTLIEIGTEGPADFDKIRSIVGGLSDGQVEVQEFGAPDDVLIRIELQSVDGDARAQEIAQNELINSIRQGLSGLYPGRVADLSAEALASGEAGVEITFSASDPREADAISELSKRAFIRSIVTDLALGEVEVNAPAEEDTVQITLRPGGDEGAASLDPARVQTQVFEALNGAYPGAIEYRRVEVVGPKVSGELVKAGTLAVLVAVVMMLIYIWFRFEWQFSLGAVLALIHDVVLTIGIFSLLQLEFTLAIIAALLTIVGYSMNDTVVVYDRVRENLRKYKKMDLGELLDLSINETLSRTTMTSVTTLLALLALYVFGGEVIRGFTFAMIWGVIVGTYSSIFVAAPLLLFLGVKRDWSGIETKSANIRFS